MANSVLKVSQLNFYVKSLLEEDQNLTGVLVRGEISNYKKHGSGHMYFTLKDEAAAVNCVIFKNSADRIRFVPSNGMAVILSGKVSIFERDGSYRFYANDMLPDGAGALTVAFEQMKEKLARQGLFDLTYKKTLPSFPKRIGVITAFESAALQDILSILQRRYPVGEVIIFGVPVQGEGAEKIIAFAIDYFNKNNLADVLICARGGGSIEDLWAFNTEIVARAAFASTIPVISAVGHETDYTILDFVADLRAPTPSAAAELVAQDLAVFLQTLSEKKQALYRAQEKKLTFWEQKIAAYKSHSALQPPAQRIQLLGQEISSKKNALLKTMQQLLEKKQHILEKQIGLLDALNPLHILARGYALAYTKNGALIKGAEQVKAGEDIKIQLHNGSFEAQVTKLYTQ